MTVGLYDQRRMNLWEQGYRMTMAEIEIEDPQMPGCSRVMHWRDVDQAPYFPVLSSYLLQWQAEHQCRFASVEVASYDGITPDDLDHLHISLTVH